jgi:UPF0716 family protein affecting phage T7 exclusion
MASFFAPATARILGEGATLFLLFFLFAFGLFLQPSPQDG